MTEYVLGIDAGGTHTDAVLCGPEGLVAAAKTVTCHDNLPSSVAAVLAALREALGQRDVLLQRVARVTLGATLAVNALVQHKADAVGLALSAGPGLAPARFALGGHVCVVPGGLDHRGVEVSPLELDGLTAAASRWQAEGVRAIACVGKFSPRNPAHEDRMREAAHAASGLPVTRGHALSGQLNFPRRIATAYYNAAVERLHAAFLDAVEVELRHAGITAPVRLLKADGGAVPAELSRREPVQSILSGPAASVMGVMALAPVEQDDCSLLLDMGGTTTDLALFVDGSPVVDREGMLLDGRRTLVRALASLSIGVGGDSLLTPTEDGVRVGPLRQGPAAAFGGTDATFLDALNVLDAPGGMTSGDAAASCAAMSALAASCGRQASTLARQALDDALRHIGQAAADLLRSCNERPVYTLAALKGMRTLHPRRAWLVGGPAQRMRERLSLFMDMPVDCPAHSDVANAVGAALTLPTATLDVYADSGRGRLYAPALDHEESMPRSWRLPQVEERAMALLREQLAPSVGQGEAVRVEVLESHAFATLDDGGFGSRDMRVSCQVVPGIAGRLASGGEAAWR